MMAAKGWIAVYDPGLVDRETGLVRVRFLRTRGWKDRRGPWGRQRVVRVSHPALTDDIEKAYEFRSPSEALQHLEHFYGRGVLIKSWRLVKVEEGRS